MLNFFSSLIIFIILLDLIIVKSYYNTKHIRSNIRITRNELDFSSSSSSSFALALFSTKSSSSSSTATLYTTPIQKVNKTPILKLIDPKSQTEIILIGVSHGSPYSAELVKNTIEDLQPACVILELCADRFISISLDSKIEPYGNQSWIDRYALNLKYRQEEALKTSSSSSSSITSTPSPSANDNNYNQFSSWRRDTNNNNNNKKNNKKNKNDGSDNTTDRKSSSSLQSSISSWWLGVNRTITKTKATAKFISSHGVLPGFVIIMSLLGSGTQLLTATFAASSSTLPPPTTTDTNVNNGKSSMRYKNNRMNINNISSSSSSSVIIPRMIEDEFTTAIRISKQLNIPIRLADASQNDTLASLNTLISPALVNPREIITGIKNMLFSFIGIRLPNTLDKALTISTLTATTTASVTSASTSTTTTTTSATAVSANNSKKNNSKNNNNKQSSFSLSSIFTSMRHNTLITRMTAPPLPPLTPLVPVETALSESQWVSIPRIYFDNPSLVKSILPLLILSAMLVVFDIVSAADYSHAVDVATITTSSSSNSIIGGDSTSMSTTTDNVMNIITTTTTNDISMAMMKVMDDLTNTVKSSLTYSNSNNNNNNINIANNINDIMRTATSTITKMTSNNHNTIDDDSFSLPLSKYLYSHNQIYFSQLVRQIGPNLEFFLGNFIHFLEFAVLIRLSKIIGTDRDKILTKNIQSICQEKQFRGKQVVVVIGMLHSNGIARYIMTGADPFNSNDDDDDDDDNKQ